MAREIIQKKLDQIRGLLTDLGRLLWLPFGDFAKNIDLIRSAERSFQLMVELASDINNEIALERNLPIPDTYRGSFVKLANAGVITMELAERLVEGARLRNVLVHEYSFDEDHRVFYESAKRILPAFQEYADAATRFAAQLKEKEI